MAAFDPSGLSAVILAGGQGQRMNGRDKGLLSIDGVPLVAHVVHAMRGQAGTIFVSANRNVECYAAYGEVLRDANAGFRGPLAGIATALRTCSTPWLMSVPVDCPSPPADLARRLHQGACVHGGEFAVAWDGMRVQPLFALYRRALVDCAEQALRDDASVVRWQQRLNGTRVDFSAQAAHFENLNCPEEVHAWQVRAHG